MNEARHHSSFSLPVYRMPTGKLQFRIDGASEQKTERGIVKRGEVVAVKNLAFAARMADGGQFAHVAADTPVGVPAGINE